MAHKRLAQPAAGDTRRFRSHPVRLRIRHQRLRASVGPRPSHAIPLAGVLFCAAPAGAQPNEWLDPIGGSWLDSERWSTGMVPSAVDDVVVGVVGGPFTIDDVSGNIHSLLLSTDATLVAGDIHIGGGLQSTAVSTQFLEGGWFVGGPLAVDPTSSLTFAFGSTVEVDGLASNSGILEWKGTGVATVGDPTIVTLRSGLVNTGDIRLHGTRFLDTDALGLRVEVIGNLVNSGQIRNREGDSSDLIVSAGQLINESGGTIGDGGIGTLPRVSSELINQGQAAIESLGTADAHHHNHGALLVGKQLLGDSITNHTAALFGNPSIAVERIDASGVAIENSGMWRAGGDFQSFTQSATGVLSLALMGTEDDPPPFFSESLLLSGGAVLDGLLALDFARDDLDPSHPLFPRVGDAHLLLTAESITGVFSDWTIGGLPSSLGAELQYSDTTITLMIVPSPGSVSLGLVAAAACGGRRRRDSSRQIGAAYRTSESFVWSSGSRQPTALGSMKRTGPRQVC